MLDDGVCDGIYHVLANLGIHELLALNGVVDEAHFDKHSWHRGTEQDMHRVLPHPPVTRFSAKGSQVALNARGQFRRGNLACRALNIVEQRCQGRFHPRSGPARVMSQCS